MKVSGLTILRNGISCGYTFLETISTLSAICDEVVVCEGYSDDGTYEAINDARIPKVTIHRDNWQPGSDGTEFARITNLGIGRCTGDYVLYLQADELLHENDYDTVSNILRSGQHSAYYCDFLHLRYDIDLCIANDAYTQAIRGFRNHGIYSIADGYSFGGNIESSAHFGVPIYHAGYVFLENILLKMINHASKYYLQNDNYQDRAAIARELLAKLPNVTIEEAHRRLEPFYNLKRHDHPIPAALERHRGATKYTVRTP